jgi:hypothetical protein
MERKNEPRVDGYDWVLVDDSNAKAAILKLTEEQTSVGIAQLPSSCWRSK